MVAPKIRIKRPAAPVVVEPEDEEQVAVEQEPEPETDEELEVAAADESDEEDVSPYEDLSIEDLRAEAKGRGLDETGRRSVLIQRLEEDDAKPVVKKTVAAPKPAPKPAAKSATVAPKPVSKPTVAAPKPAPKPVPVTPTLIPQKVEEEDVHVVRKATLGEVFELLKPGQALVVSREDKNTWILSMVETQAVTKIGSAEKVASSGPKLRGDAYWKEVLSPEYYSWYYEDAGDGKAWSSMTPEEKSAMCDNLGVEYEAHEDARVNALHQVQALLDKLEIKKYKPEYQSTNARDALKA